jgi:hypothetical protein
LSDDLAASEPKHFGAIGLAREVESGAGVEVVIDYSKCPTKRRIELAPQHGSGFYPVAPRPEIGIGPMVKFQEAPGMGRRLINFAGQAFGSHPVLGAKYALLAQMPFMLMGLFGAIRWNQARLLAES